MVVVGISRIGGGEGGVGCGQTDGASIYAWTMDGGRREWSDPDGVASLLRRQTWEGWGCCCVEVNGWRLGAAANQDGGGRLARESIEGGESERDGDGARRERRHGLRVWRVEEVPNAHGWVETLRIVSSASTSSVMLRAGWRSG